MRIRTFRVTHHFQKKFDALSDRIQKRAIKTLQLLQKDVTHPSLRLHKLSGKHKIYWSVSVTRSYRIIFQPLTNDIVALLTIGTHAVYE
jgi:toxin HigB-1